MKFLIFFQITFLSIFLINDSNAQILNQKTVTQKVYGNCGMCKKTIEKAANVKGISKAEWDADLAMAKITIDSTKTSVDDVLKRIAAVGYESEKCRVPDDVYDKLQRCCRDDRLVKKD